MPVANEIFGHYRIEEKLGEGAFGAVFRAEDLRLHRKVAIKILHPRGDEDADGWGRLLEEARAASALNHPNICASYDIGEEAGLNYIVLEYVEGQPLGEMIRAGPLPLETALNYTAQMAHALAHAHARRIVHRDLKASNVLITPDGQAKLLDFGLARRLDSQAIESMTHSRESLSAIGALAGTLCYMSPEVLRGKAAGPRSDLWSLGALLHEMLTGQLPFRGATPFELSMAIMVEHPQPLPPRISSAVRTLVEKCLQKEPRHRYASAELLLAGLEAARAKLEKTYTKTFLRRPQMLAAISLTILLTLAVAWRIHRDWQPPGTVPPAVEVIRNPPAPQPSLDSAAKVQGPPPASHTQRPAASGRRAVWVNTKSGIYHCTKPTRFNPDNWQVMPLLKAKKLYRPVKGQSCS